MPRCWQRDSAGRIGPGHRRRPRPIVAERRQGQAADGAALAKKAERIEQKADRIAVDVRGEIDRLDADRRIERLVNLIEDAIDELEQAAFAASLIPNGP